MKFSEMLYAVLGMFFGIVLSSAVLSWCVLHVHQGFWTNFVIVLLVSIVIWLFFDNLSILEDVKSRKRLREQMHDVQITLEILRMERHEIYRDLRNLEMMKHKEIRRNALIHSSSCKF